MSETTQQETALTVAQPKQAAEIVRSARQTRLAAFTPANLTEAIALAKMMAASDMVPRDYQKKPANILVAIQFGSEIGLAPMQSLQSVSVINGRPSLWGDAALALCQSHPDFEDILETTEGTVAVCIVKRKGRTPVKRTFSDEDAARAGLLTKGPWTQYRFRMRQMRARGFALRDSFADVLKGISIAEESMDLPVDTSQAKKTREELSLDTSILSPSSEPNRGHEDTGLNGKTVNAKPEQPPAKETPALCNECRQTGSHSSDCKFAVKAEQDKRTAQFTRAAYMLQKVEAKTSKKHGKYLYLEVVTNAGTGTLYVWRTTLHEHFTALDLSKPAPMIADVSQQEKDGKKFIEVEHLVELAGRAFVDDRPAEVGEPEEGLFGSEEA
jgi:hypothetical protein